MNGWKKNAIPSNLNDRSLGAINMNHFQSARSNSYLNF